MASLYFFIAPHYGFMMTPDSKVCVCVESQSWITLLLLLFLFSKLCLTLSDPKDCSPPGSSVHGISQASKLEWVAIFFSGDLPKPGIEPEAPACPALQADCLPLSHQRSLPEEYY